MVFFFSFLQSEEKKPRESILRSEFANAIEFINKDLPNENRLKFLHWDLHKHSRRYLPPCSILYKDIMPVKLCSSNPKACVAVRLKVCLLCWEKLRPTP